MLQSSIIKAGRKPLVSVMVRSLLPESPFKALSQRQGSWYWDKLSMMHGTYIGDLPQFKGKTALLRVGPDGILLAQFDDLSTGCGHGWYEFNRNEWRINEISIPQ